jgi:ankyrin repeat protein
MPKYTALSYAWGNPGSEYRISLNGRQVKVRRNLWRFLSQVRQHPAVLFDLVWIDALCIEQDDDDERTHQVALMGEIYKSAERVIAWLGPSYSGSDQAMHDLQRGVPCWIKSKRAAKKWTSSAASAIRGLCVRRYWERLWIFQELLLAREALLMCGSSFVSLNTFRDCLQTIADRYDSLANPENEERSNHAAEQWEFRCVRYSPAMAVMLLVKEKEDERSVSSIYDLMMATRQMQCSKIRDRVYGVLSATQNAGDIVTIDYDISIAALIHGVLREHHIHHPPKTFDEIAEHCRRLAAIMHINPDDVFIVPQEEIIPKSSMHVMEFKLPDSIDPFESDRELFSPTTEVEQSLRTANARPRGIETVSAMYSRGLPGNPITFIWAVCWKHSAMINFMLDTGAVDVSQCLSEAIRMNHYVVVEALLDAKNGHHRRDIDMPITGDVNALQLALHSDRPEIAKLLIQAGANVNMRGSDRTTGSGLTSFGDTFALQLAAMFGSPSMVELLLKYGASIGATCYCAPWDDLTALDAALLKGRAENAEVLLRRLTQIDAEVLKSMANNGEIAISTDFIVRFISRLKGPAANVHALLREVIELHDDEIPKHISANGQIIISRKLIELYAQRLQRRADQAQFLLGDSASSIKLPQWVHILRTAVDSCEVNGVRVILQFATKIYKLSDLEMYSPDKTMVQRAVDLYSLGIIRALLAGGLSPDTNKGEQGSALQIAVQSGLHDVATILLERGAETTASLRGSLDHPLHLAVSKPCIDQTRLLIQYGADVNLLSKSGNGKSPLHVALALDPVESVPIAWILIASGADIDCKVQTIKETFDQQGKWDTPLSIAVARHNHDVVKMLLQLGAKIDSPLDHIPGSAATPCNDMLSVTRREVPDPLIEYGWKNAPELEYHDMRTQKYLLRKIIKNDTEMELDLGCPAQQDTSDVAYSAASRSSSGSSS